MSSLVIGRLLDRMLTFVQRGYQLQALADLRGAGLVPQDQQISHIEAARLLLIDYLHRMDRLDYGEPIVGCTLDPIPTYWELIRSRLPPKAPLGSTPARERRPDLVLDQVGQTAVLEVGYGFDPDQAMPAIDRVIDACLAAGWRKSIALAAYLFVHETSMGEIIRDTEHAIDDWIGAHFGPFHGLSRCGSPAMPRLTRSARSHVALAPVIDDTRRSTTHVAFCISFEYRGA